MQFGGREGEWRVHGESKEFTMRKWVDQGRADDMKRRDEGGEWNLKSVWEKDRVTCSEVGYSDDMENTAQEEGGSKVCCCDAVSGVKTLVTLFAVINLGTITTGGVGFTLGLVDYWGDQDLFTSVMVTIVNSILSIIILLCHRWAPAV